MDILHGGLFGLCPGGRKGTVVHQGSEGRVPTDVPNKLEVIHEEATGALRAWSKTALYF